MKLGPHQLGEQLSKRLAPIYLITGDEPLLKYESIQLIRKASKALGIHERIRLTPTITFNWDELYSLLHATSLLAEQSLLEFDFRNHLPTKTAGQVLKEYGANPLSNKIVVIDLEKIDEKIAKSEWYPALEKTGVVVTAWPIQRHDLPKWIQNRAKKYKLTINEEATQFLADYVEGNLVAAAQTIEKIYLLKPETNVDIHCLKSIVMDESHYTIFDFLERLIAAERPHAIHILNQLKVEGVEPTLILWGITRELRLLAELKQKLKQGETNESLFKKYRIYFGRQNAFRHFLNNFSEEACFQLIRSASELDKILKGAKKEDVWRALELFCLRF